MRTQNYGDKADLKKLKAALSKERNPLNMIIELIVRTGCRQEEAINLPIDAINPTKGALLILGVKGSCDRVGFVNKAFAAELKSMFGNVASVYEFFGIRAGDPNYVVRKASLLRALRKRWDLVRMQVLGYDVKLTLHGLRATYAITGYEDLDHDVLAVQELLGHKSIGSTMRYVAISRTSNLSARIRERLG